MPRREDDTYRYATGHPPACTCVDCVNRRLRKRRSRRKVIAIVVVVVAVVIGIFHNQIAQFFGSL
jgi:hypothetical protein